MEFSHMRFITNNSLLSVHYDCMETEMALCKDFDPGGKMSRAIDAAWIAKLRTLLWSSLIMRIASYL